MAKKPTDELKETAKKAVDAVSEVVNDAADAAKPVVEKAKKATKPATDKAVAAAKTATKTVKDTAKKVTPRKPEYYVQFAGKEVDLEELTERAKGVFKAENKRAAVLSCRIYLKPEENAAYYVINDSFFGKFDI